MADFFGIDRAVRSVVDAYFAGARRSGRSHRLLESLQDGDRVICVNHKQADLIRDACRRRGLRTRVLVVDPAQPQNLFTHRGSEGRTIFDHVWIEQFYQNGIDRIAVEIGEMEKEFGGAPRPAPARMEYRA